MRGTIKVIRGAKNILNMQIVQDVERLSRLKGGDNNAVTTICYSYNKIFQRNVKK